MRYFFELLSASKQTFLALRRKLNGIPVDGSQWIEWTPELRFICDLPHVTLIDTHGMDWNEVHAWINAGKGREVVLIGNGSSMLGLPMLHGDFDLSDLTALMVECYQQTQAQSGPQFPTLPAPAESGFQSTMSVPVF